MNKCIFIGRLTKETELRSVGNTNIFNNSLAVSRRYKNANGENIEEVLFLDFTAFGKLAEIMVTYLNKGSKVCLVGYLKLETWQDNNGNNHQKHKLIVEELEMLDYKQENNTTYTPQKQTNMQSVNAYQQPKPKPQPQPKQEPKQDIKQIDLDDTQDEDLPF